VQGRLQSLSRPLPKALEGKDSGAGDCLVVIKFNNNKHVICDTVNAGPAAWQLSLKALVKNADVQTHQ
jgi:hypothetical protein